jgi:hypothetical protein
MVTAPLMVFAIACGYVGSGAGLCGSQESPVLLPSWLLLEPGTFSAAYNCE